MKTKTHIKAGSLTANHNETLVTKTSRSLKIKSGIKAGLASSSSSDARLVDSFVSRA